MAASFMGPSHRRAGKTRTVDFRDKKVEKASKKYKITAERSKTPQAWLKYPYRSIGPEGPSGRRKGDVGTSQRYPGSYYCQLILYWT